MSLIIPRHQIEGEEREQVGGKTLQESMAKEET